LSSGSFEAKAWQSAWICSSLIALKSVLEHDFLIRSDMEKNFLQSYERMPLPQRDFLFHFEVSVPFNKGNFDRDLFLGPFVPMKTISFSYITEKIGSGSYAGRNCAAGLQASSESVTRAKEWQKNLTLPLLSTNGDCFIRKMLRTCQVTP
jgi:hypothetical protein